MVVHRQLEGNAQQVQAIRRHPARAIRLVHKAARGQRLAAVEYTDVVEAEEAALKNISSLLVLTVHPPGKIQKKLLKYALQKHQVAGVIGIGFAALAAINLKDAKGGPRVDRRVHVAKRPFVRRQLAVRVHVPFACEQDELALGKFRVDVREGDAMEREV